MGSTPTPLRPQKSLKFHINDKPSIKITVSSDALAESILKNNMSSTEDDDSSSEGSPQPALIQIVGNCCGGGVNTSNGVLCSCANGDDKRTRIALDDYTVLEFPNCIDFGIKDFLCCKDEIELDLSSDTDASYLDATPPHRFSDSELENQIEAMSITLDTQLNPFPNKSPFLMGSDFLPEDDIAEESFLMDEEEVSSSTSNSAATICGGSGAGDFEHDDHISTTSSDLTNGDTTTMDPPYHHLISNSSEHDDDNTDKTQSIISHIDDSTSSENLETGTVPLSIHEENEETLESGECGKNVDDLQIPTQAQHETRINEEEMKDHNGTSQLVNSSCGVGENNIANPNAPPPQHEQAESIKPQAISQKMLKHPTKHFKRQISLPASIFMSYLIEQNNKANYCKHQNHHHQMQQHADNLNHHLHNCDIIVKNKLNRSNSCSKKTHKSNNGIKLLSKIDSYRSTKVIHGSTEDYDDDDIHNSNNFSDTNEDYEGVGRGRNGATKVGSIGGNEGANSPLDFTKSNNWAWESKSDSFTDTEDFTQEEYEDEQQAFTSEVEKRSLILRHVRKLIRQDTTGNFAPPDFSI